MNDICLQLHHKQGATASLLSDEDRDHLEDCLLDVEFSSAPDQVGLSEMEQINDTFLPANAASRTVYDRLWPMQLSCSTRNQRQAAPSTHKVQPDASCTRTTEDAVADPTQRWASRATCGPTLMSRLDDSSHRCDPAVSTSASHTVENVSVVVEASHGGVSHDSLRVCNKVQLTVCGGALPSQRLLASTLVDGVMDGFLHYPSLTILNAKFTFDRVTEEREADGDVRTVMYDARGRLDVRVHRLNVASRGEKLAENTISLVAMFLACSIAADELQAATKAPPEKPPFSSSSSQGTCCPSGVTTKLRLLPQGDPRSKGLSTAGLSELFCCCCCRKTNISND